jgi:hypothetical protein
MLAKRWSRSVTGGSDPSKAKETRSPIVGERGRVIRSPEIDLEITTPKAELADARRVLAQWRAERAPQPDEIEFQRIDARRRDALSPEERLSGTCAKIHVAHGTQKLTAQQSRMLGLFLLAASNDSPVPDDVCDACIGQGSHIQSGMVCPHCDGTGAR